MFRSSDSRPHSSKLQVWCVEPLPIRPRDPPRPSGILIFILYLLRREFLFESPASRPYSSHLVSV